MICGVCLARAAVSGVLCDDCQDDLTAPAGLVPDHIVAQLVHRTDAALVDAWGRPHPLEVQTLIGRTIERTGLLVLASSVSRHHARIAEDRERGAWMVRDLGSANGTLVNERRISEPVAIQHGDRLGIGQVNFYFIVHATRLPPVWVDPATIVTMPPFALGHWPEPPAASVAPAVAVDETADVRLPEMRLRLIEPTGGGGGVLDVDGLEVQLTPGQFELLAVLARRMNEDGHQPAQVRGFVRTSELLGAVSWDSREPSDNHLKQLIRRLRRTLVRTGVGDLLESRPRFGYRLRVVPRAP